MKDTMYINILYLVAQNMFLFDILEAILTYD